MRLVAVVVDSAANIPAEVARELHIVIVPMYLAFGDQVFRDGLDLTPSDFYERLVRDRELASTSTPSPGDYREAFESTGQRDVVCVTVAARMSGSHQQATLAAREYAGRVEVVDSGNASMAEGFVAVEAARLAARGATIDVVAGRARTISERVGLVATVDTFEFLQRSGRVTKLQAYAATMLDIKPVFRFRGGDIVPVARSRTRLRAVDRVAEETLREAAGRPVHLAVFHAAAEDEAEILAGTIRAATSVLESHVVAVTPVIGAHTGPGLLGTAFFTEPDHAPTTGGGPG